MATVRELIELSEEMATKFQTDATTDPEQVEEWLNDNSLTLDVLTEFSMRATDEQLMVQALKALVAHPDETGVRSVVGSTLMLGFFIGVEYANRQHEEF